MDDEIEQSGGIPGRKDARRDRKTVILGKLAARVIRKSAAMKRARYLKDAGVPLRYVMRKRKR